MSKKARLFAAVRAASVRILLGSTAKMGVGTNVQRRLVAIHQLNVPWRPADVEQREAESCGKETERRIESSATSAAAASMPTAGRR